MLRAQVTASRARVDDRVSRLDQGRAQVDPVRVADDRPRSAPGRWTTSRWLDSAIRIANANNTSIYSFDPRGLDMNIRPSDDPAVAGREDRRQAVLEQRAGAVAARDRQERERVLPARLRLGEEPGRRQVPQDRGEGEAARASRCSARTGYFAPSTTEMDTARKKAAEDEAPPEISKALSTIVDAPHMAVAGDLWAGAAPGPTARRASPWRGRRETAAADAARRRCARAREDGRVYFDGPVQRQPRRVRRRARHAAPPPAPDRRRRLGGRPRGLDARGAGLRARAAGDRLTGRVPRPHADASCARSRPIRIRSRSPAASSSAPIGSSSASRWSGPAAADATVTANLLSRRGAPARDAAAQDRAGPRLRDRPADRLDRARRVRHRDCRLARRRPGEDARLVPRRQPAVADLGPRQAGPSARPSTLTAA